MYNCCAVTGRRQNNLIRLHIVRKQTLITVLFVLSTEKAKNDTNIEVDQEFVQSALLLIFPRFRAALSHVSENEVEMMLVGTSSGLHYA